jgi:hypothetical protein
LLKVQRQCRKQRTRRIGCNASSIRAQRIVERVVVRSAGVVLCLSSRGLRMGVDVEEHVACSMWEREPAARIIVLESPPEAARRVCYPHSQPSLLHAADVEAPQAFWKPAYPHEASEEQPWG